MIDGGLSAALAAASSAISSGAGAVTEASLLTAETLGDMMTGVAELANTGLMPGADVAGSTLEVLDGSKSALQALAGNVGAEIGSNVTGGLGPMGEFGAELGKSAGESLATPNKVSQTFGQVATGSPEIDSAFKGAVNYLSDPTTHMTSSQFSEVQNNLAGKSFDMTGGALEKASQADKSFGEFISKTTPSGNYDMTRDLTTWEKIKTNGPEYAKDALKYAAGQKMKNEVNKAFTPNKVAQAQGQNWSGEKTSGLRQKNNSFNMYDNFYMQIGGLK